LYGKRSRLAHGEERRAVDHDELADVRVLAAVLLQADVGDLDPARADALRARAGLA
jgi:hypothetical protein